MISERLGLRRLPAVTLAVFLVTAASNALQFAVHGMLADLQRTPAGLHGDWWRSATSLFVQDGGVMGTLSNLAFLLAVGAVAEQVLPRGRWLALYFGVGLASEFAGYAWQPTGGGNSIAICGLTGAVALALWRGDPRLPSFTPQLLVIWSGALLATWWTPFFLLCVVGVGLTKAVSAAGLPAARMATAAIVVTAIVLAALQNLHGAALILSLATSPLMTTRPHQVPREHAYV